MTIDLNRNTLIKETEYNEIKEPISFEEKIVLGIK